MAGSLPAPPSRPSDAHALHAQAAGLLAPTELRQLTDGDPFPPADADSGADDHRVVTFLHHLCSRFNDPGFPAALAKVPGLARRGRPPVHA